MKEELNENLAQLITLLKKMDNADYTYKSPILSGSTIGQHIRHILEFYIVLIETDGNAISYDKRKRDAEIENSIAFAIETIEKIENKIENIVTDAPIVFEADFTENGKHQHQIKSSMGREIAYCLEHSIHHQALIKAGLIELEKKHLIDDKFGVAYSTLRFKNKICAQ